MARSFLGGEFVGGESAWWRGDWIPYTVVKQSLNPKDNLLFLLLFSLFKNCMHDEL